MNIYKIYQTVNNDYDTYDSAIVVAESPEEAKRICPSSFYEIGTDDNFYSVFGRKKLKGESISSWCRVADVQVEYIGIADKSMEKGVVLASYNAG